jgi:hypothetical protein
MSEIARLRAQIERECESIRLAMYGFAAVSSHAIIERKYNTLGEHQEELEKLVGKDEAGNIVARTYAKVVG